MRTLRPWLLVALLALGACRDDTAARPSDSGAFSPESLARPSSDASEAAPAAPEIPADAPLVVFLGDSITAGLHVDPREAFPAVVQRRLAADGLPFRLVNAGVSGDTSAGGLRRLDWLLGQAPDVLVLELGGNDGLRGQPAREIEARLEQIVARSRAKDVAVLVLGVRLPPSLGLEYVREFEAVYEHLAAGCSACGYVPFFMEGAAAVPGMMQADGLHPTREGHERIATKIAPALRTLLEARAR